MRPKASIIVPTYNRPVELQRAISSVLDQTYKKFELIVVDDKSDVDVEHIINSFGDSRIKYVEHDTNQGGSAARNTGIEFATGEYIAFLDDDDIWRDKKLEVQVGFMETNNSDASYTDFEFKSEYRASNIVRPLLPDNNRAKPSGKDILIYQIISGELSLGGASTLMIRRNVIEQIDGFDEDYDRLQDWEFIVRVLEETRLDHLDEELVLKVGYNPPSGESIEDAWEQFRQDFSEYVESAREKGFEPQRNMDFVIARAYLRDGHIRSGAGKLSMGQMNGIKPVISIGFSLLLGLSGKIS